MNDPGSSGEGSWDAAWRRFRTRLRPAASSKKGTSPHVGKAFFRRTLLPINQVNHWVYILVGVVLLGGLGTLIEYYSLLAYQPRIMDADWQRCAKSLTSYALAVSGTAAVQMVLYEEGDEQLRAPAVALLSLVVLLSVPVLTNGVKGPENSHAFAIGATFIALLLCWIAAANNTPKTDAIATIGGTLNDPSAVAPLPGHKPNFKT